MPKTLAQQIGGRCKHFTGMQHGQCRAGVVYLTVRATDCKGLAAIPCFREGEAVPCEKRCFPTPEEVATEVAGRDAEWENLKLAISACSENAKTFGYKKGLGGKGVIRCPVCKTGQLHYTVASYNGHMWGKCNTKGCVSWMQ